MAIKKDPTTSIRKHANELEVHEKTVRTAIKQDLSPGLKPLYYTIWGVLENKTNATTWMLTKRIEKKLDGNYSRMI